MIYDFNNISPKLDKDSWFAPNSVLIGNVTLKKDANIWFNATLRGDVEPITIGEGSNIQDNSIINTLGEEITTNIVFSCGSGVTASVLALAYSLINNKYMPTIYDGSWAEYGKN